MHPITSPNQSWQLLRPAMKTNSKAPTYSALSLNPSANIMPDLFTLSEYEIPTVVHDAFLFVS